MLLRYRNDRQRISHRLALVVLALAWCAIIPRPASAAPGALVATVPLAVPGFGVSIAVGCDASPILYYTIGTAQLERMTPSGVDLGPLPTVDPAGSPVVLDEMAYDAKNDV